MCADSSTNSKTNRNTKKQIEADRNGQKQTVTNMTFQMKKLRQKTLYFADRLSDTGKRRRKQKHIDPQDIGLELLYVQ